MKLLQYIFAVGMIMGLLAIYAVAHAGELTLNEDLSGNDAKFTQVCRVGDHIGIRWYPGAVIVGKLDKTRITVASPKTADAGTDDQGNPTVWYMFKTKKVGTVRIQLEWCDPKKCTVNGYVVDINP